MDTITNIYAYYFGQLKRPIIARVAEHIPDDFLRHLAEARMRDAIITYDLGYAFALCKRNSSLPIEDTTKIMSGAFEVLAQDQNIFNEVMVMTHVHMKRPECLTPIS